MRTRVRPLLYSAKVTSFCRKAENGSRAVSWLVHPRQAAQHSMSCSKLKGVDSCRARVRPEQNCRFANRVRSRREPTHVCMRQLGRAPCDMLGGGTSALDSGPMPMILLRIVQVSQRMLTGGMLTGIRGPAYSTSGVEQVCSERIPVGAIRVSITAKTLLRRKHTADVKQYARNSHRVSYKLQSYRTHRLLKRNANCQSSQSTNDAVLTIESPSCWHLDRVRPACK